MPLFSHIWLLLCWDMLLLYLLSGELSQVSVKFCQRLYLQLLRWPYVFYSFSLIWCIILMDWFANIKESLQSWDEANVLRMQWCMTFSICCWILFARSCRKFSVSMFINMFSDIDLEFSFFVESLSGFSIRVMVVSYNELGSLPSSAISGRVWVG